MKIPFAIVALILTQISHAQIKATKLNKTDIPKTISYKGHIIDAVRYTDKTGEHIIITTETSETKTKNSEK